MEKVVEPETSKQKDEDEKNRKNYTEKFNRI